MALGRLRTGSRGKALREELNSETLQRSHLPKARAEFFSCPPGDRHLAGRGPKLLSGSTWPRALCLVSKDVTAITFAVRERGAPGASRREARPDSPSYCPTCTMEQVAIDARRA